jgi:hypothetical protein
VDRRRGGGGVAGAVVACGERTAVSDAFVLRLARNYFDAEVAPGLRASGTPDGAIEWLRDRHAEDVLTNPVATEELLRLHAGEVR